MVEAADHARTKARLPGLSEQPDRRRAAIAPSWRGSPRLSRRHDLLVISDEIYERLVYGGHEHVAFASLPGHAGADRSIIGGFSKSYAMTGWRIG